MQVVRCAQIYPVVVDAQGCDMSGQGKEMDAYESSNKWGIDEHTSFSLCLCGSTVQ
jgi:hypothetical protein